jgi:hypothetical protein
MEGERADGSGRRRGKILRDLEVVSEGKSGSRERGRGGDEIGEGCNPEGGPDPGRSVWGASSRKGGSRERH